MFASSGSTGGRGSGDAKTIISPNTSFGDIITKIILSRTKTSTQRSNSMYFVLKYGSLYYKYSVYSGRPYTLSMYPYLSGPR